MTPTMRVCAVVAAEVANGKRPVLWVPELPAAIERVALAVEQWRLDDSKRRPGEPEFLWGNGTTQLVRVERRQAVTVTAEVVETLRVTDDLDDFAYPHLLVDKSASELWIWRGDEDRSTPKSEQVRDHWLYFLPADPVGGTVLVLGEVTVHDPPLTEMVTYDLRCDRCGASASLPLGMTCDDHRPHRLAAPLAVPDDGRIHDIEATR